MFMYPNIHVILHVELNEVGSVEVEERNQKHVLLFMYTFLRKAKD